MIFGGKEMQETHKTKGHSFLCIYIVIELFPVYYETREFFYEITSMI